MAEDWYADVKKYVPGADTNVVAAIVRYCGIALQNRDSSLVSFSDPAEVPHHVITMGIGTIMEARRCLVLAMGPKKAAAVAAMAEGPITASCPASILQMHPNCTLVTDESAAADLARVDYYRWVYDNKPAWQLK